MPRLAGTCPACHGARPTVRDASHASTSRRLGLLGGMRGLLGYAVADHGQLDHVARLGTKRVGLPAVPPRRRSRRAGPARSIHDYEYVRNGIANVFCVVEPKTGRRLTRATRRRTNRDFARMLHRISRAYPKARRIHLVADNLSTHSVKACIETFGERQGKSLWRRFKVHLTPKHGSWLNAAEMEASLLGRQQCLGKRPMPDLPTLAARGQGVAAGRYARRHAYPMEVPREGRPARVPV